jgi:hypothetical protein
VCFQIFTEDTAEVEMLPRDEVIEYLERTAKNLVIPYLVSSLRNAEFPSIASSLQEHIINIWEDHTTDFHNRLAQAYKEEICELMPEYLNSLPEGELYSF